MDFKKEFKNQLELIKTRLRERGQPSRNEDIANVLGYTRTYFSALLGHNGKVTEDHLKKLRAYFPEMSDNDTSVVNEEAPAYGAKYDDVLRSLAESYKLLAESHRDVAASNRMMARMLSLDETFQASPPSEGGAAAGSPIEQKRIVSGIKERKTVPRPVKSKNTGSGKNK